jgi:hypothetical protein
MRASKPTACMRSLCSGIILLLVGCAHPKNDAINLDGGPSLTLSARLARGEHDGGPHRLLVEVVNCSSGRHRIYPPFSAGTVMFSFSDGTGRPTGGASCAGPVGRTREQPVELAPQERWAFECELSEVPTSTMREGAIRVDARLRVDGAEQELATSITPRKQSEVTICRPE